MRAGSLRYIITIEKPVTTRNDYGSQVVEWKEVTSTRASVSYPRGNRESDGIEVYYDYNPTFNIRYYHNIDNYMRIKYDGKYYRILSVQSNVYSQMVTIVTELINE